tara:strand:- start:6889 stop:7851 length:963 start_codon:yes stop_codon:yes gene_type:complete
MAALDKEKKSNRLLGSRRYTHDTLNDSQEAFTEVLDLRSSEIYTQGHLVPNTGLPFSGSSSNLQVHTIGGQNVVKYYYRWKLTKSNLNNEAWFFLDPTGSDSGIGAQLIDANQKTNFISPKYSAVALANATTEDNTPGYNVIVYKSTQTNTGSLSGGDIVSANDYVFDYKSGVLQFNSSAVDPSNSQYVYMTAYQYVGTTLRTGLEIDGDIIAKNYIVSSSVTYITSSFSSGSTIFGDTGDDTHRFTGSVFISGSLQVEGQTLFDSLNVDSASLVVSGAMKIVDQQVGSAVKSSSLFMENLGTIGNKDLSGVIDLGDGFQ